MANIKPTFNAFNTCTKSTGIKEENATKPISIYPNPNNGSFTVQATGIIEIYNSMGTLVLRQQLVDEKNLLHLNTFSKGIYLLKVLDGNKIHSQKIIIQ
ncbi:MAG: T9SS type A sorting domain-containing protein [Bacteroidetes bacterium]|nr:T9SS type A sorting domain-containing protein [Bacteroidota bacterium]